MGMDSRVVETLEVTPQDWLMNRLRGGGKCAEESHE